MTDEVIEAIEGRPDLNVYVRGRALVTIARDGAGRDTWIARPPGAPVIVRLDPPRMLAVIDNATRWTKLSARTKKQQPAFPLSNVVMQVLGRLEWPLAYLEGVIETPTIRPDGSILSNVGYDRATGLLYEPVPGCNEWPGIPERPTAYDVRRAIEALLEPVVNFPFVATSDRSTYIAAVLTLIARHLIYGPAPLFPIRAPTPGTGKGLLASVIGLIGTGREPAAMTMVEGDELRKRITAIAIAGTPLVLLDNVSGTIGSDVFAAALTCKSWTDRVLGASETTEVALRTVWIATGNNVGFSRTLGRRAVPIDLDAKVETPEDRTGFKIDDLLGFVRIERQRLVTAALTILRGFHVAGRPRHKAPRIGSFEAWDDLIRSAVIWAGEPDPAQADDPTRGRGRLRALADDDVADVSVLLGDLRRAFGDKSWTAKDVWSRRDGDPNLRAAVDLAAASRGDRSKAATLGSLRYTLRAYADRPIRGLMLLHVSDPTAREQHWVVTERAP